MSPRIPTRTATRSDGTVLKAFLGISPGGGHPYFSLTGEVWKGRQLESAGTIHDELLREWPDLKLAVDLHLSDLDGVPMHAEANGWYWLSGYLGGFDEQYHGSNDGRHTPEQCLDILIDHIHVGTSEKEKEGWRGTFKVWHVFTTKALAREAWQKLVEAMRPVWKAQAEAAFQQYGLVPA